MKIIAVLTQAETAVACLDAAVAARVALPGASIEVLPTVVNPDAIVAAVAAKIRLDPRSEGDENGVEERAAACEDAYIRWRRASVGDRPEVEWKNLVGRDDLSVRGEAADASLIVLARGENMDAGDAAHVALFEAKTPLLLVPRQWRAKGSAGFRHVAVGIEYDAPESAAITAAQPWLRAAKRVSAIRIEAEPATAAPEHEELGRDIEVDWHVVPHQKEVDLAIQIAREAEAIGADLLVCGAYRHSSLIEWLVPGTTSHLLSHSNVPLLVAH